MAASLYDLKSNLIAKESLPYDMKEDVTVFLDKIERIAQKLFEKVENGRELLYGISLCMGGFLDTDSGILQYSVLTPEWGYNVPLKKLLQERFPGVEIAVDNVARMAARAEVLDNPFYEDKRVAAIYTDVGASACFIDKGHVLHGKHFMIGEIGMMVLSLPDAVPYGESLASFFSSQISEKTLTKKVLDQPEKLRESLLYEKREKLTLLDIFRAADECDAFAREIVRNAAWVFCAAMQNIVVSFDPEVIILQGNFSRAGKWFDACVREGMSCFPRYRLSSSFEVHYDQRPLVSLQMRGASKLMIKKFFESEEWF